MTTMQPLIITDNLLLTLGLDSLQLAGRECDENAATANGGANVGYEFWRAAVSDQSERRSRGRNKNFFKFSIFHFFLEKMTFITYS
jgi:hypothetical protein